MRRFLARLLGQPRWHVWVVTLPPGQSPGLWHKVVAASRPATLLDCHCLGPIRSEIDAEELCDRLNAEAEQIVEFYGECPDSAEDDE